MIAHAATLLLASLATTMLMMVPDALLALWLALLTDGVLDGRRTLLDDQGFARLL